MSFSTRSSRSSSSSYIDDVDAITPCPPTLESPIFAAAAPAPRQTRSPSPSSLHDGLTREKRRDSVRVLEEGTDGDPESLWERMLALQQMYGCYKSARMSAALSSGDIRLLLRKSKHTQSFCYAAPLWADAEHGSFP